jgi:serine/threonine protein kinase
LTPWGWRAIAISPVGIPLNQFENLDLDRAISIFQRLEKIIQAVHDQGYVHGDIAPPNILILNNDEVCLIDWGSALKMGTRLSLNDKPLDPRPGHVLFASLGVVENQLADSRDDWESLVYVFQWLFGRLPWDDDMYRYRFTISYEEIIFLKGSYYPKLEDPKANEYILQFFQSHHLRRVSDEDGHREPAESRQKQEILSETRSKEKMAKENRFINRLLLYGAILFLLLFIWILSSNHSEL